MNFFLLINAKMSRENSILNMSESEKAEFLDSFITMSI